MSLCDQLQHRQYGPHTMGIGNGSIGIYFPNIHSATQPAT